MSRKLWVGVTAGVLAAAAVALMVGRWWALGRDLGHPHGPGTWLVTFVVSGKVNGPAARVVCATPLDAGRQHVLREEEKSDELVARPAVDRKPDRRELIFSPRPGPRPGTFRARYECVCTLRPDNPDKPDDPRLYAPPTPGQYLGNDRLLDADHPDVASHARQLCVGANTPGDQAAALFQFVDEEIDNDPTLAGTDRSAGECVRLHSGDAAAKGRLLAALLRNRGIPARLAIGLTAAHAGEQPAHVWVEAWLRDQWLPMDPFYHHYGRAPGYLLFGFGDTRLVRGHDAKVQDCGFLVERVVPNPAGENPTLMRRVYSAASLSALPPAERRLVELLLLVPVGALIVCVFRQVIGLQTFGTFSPALLGLAFRELHSLPGILIFVCILLIGWILRRSIDRYHLLQVPRTAVLLSMVICVLIAFVTAAATAGVGVTRYIALFPMVILTGMIERFWTTEEEDSTAASFRTLFATMAVAGTISLALSCTPVARMLFLFPEALGLIVACQFLLGRYTGYRLSELWRFRDFLARPIADAGFPRVVSDRQSIGRF